MSVVSDFWTGIADGIDPSAQAHDDLPEDWEAWLRELFPSSVSKAFAPHQRELWEWVWAMGPERPRPHVAIWPREGGKSTNARAAVATLAARGVRRYALYVSGTQDQADSGVAGVGSLLESPAVAAYYPALGMRAVGKFGASRGWRRNRLQTMSGVCVDALGLEAKAIRGLLREGHRPDLIVLDDIDDLHDSLDATAKKIKTITHSILPTGTSHTAVLVTQNMIIPTGYVAGLASGTEGSLADRGVNGPVPAIRGLETYRWEIGKEIPQDVRGASVAELSRFEGVNGGITVRNIIIGGEATWGEGQSIEACQKLIDTYGLAAFLREQQHEVDEVEGALWTKDIIGRVGAAPDDLVRIVVAVDPSGGGDDVGIGAVGINRAGQLFVLEDATVRGNVGPARWGWTAVELYDRLRADRIVAEANFGGDMVAATIEVAAGTRVPVKLVTASRGKVIRAEPVVAAYEEGRVFHVGVLPELEAQQTRWVPGDPSPNRIDWLVWACTELLFPGPVRQRVALLHPPGL